MRSRVLVQKIVLGDLTNDATLRVAIARSASSDPQYVVGQLAASGSKKTRAILDPAIAAARAQVDQGIATDAAVRWVQPGDRFRYGGDVWRVTRVGRGAHGKVTMAREVPDPRDRFEKVVLVDDREFQRGHLREMSKIA